MNTNKTLAQALRDAINAADEEELPSVLGANYCLFLAAAIKTMSMIEIMELKKLIDEGTSLDRHAERCLCIACKETLEDDLDEAWQTYKRPPTKEMTPKRIIGLVSTVAGMNVPSIVLDLEKLSECASRFQRAQETRRTKNEGEN